MTKRRDVRATRRRERLGQRIARDIDAADLGKKAAAAAMGLSKTGLHNIIEGRSRLTAAAAVRLAAVLEDAQLRATGGRFAVQRVSRRARDYLMVQAEVDLSEAIASRDLAGLLAQFEKIRRRGRRTLPPAPASVYATAMPASGRGA